MSSDDNALRDRLVSLRTEHRRLDSAIQELENGESPDQLSITRMKKKKLVLKDEIATLEDRLFPDIIA
ncbi:MAG: DUF465 domain-containing protein [Pseudomonadota bacterium]